MAQQTTIKTIWYRHVEIGTDGIKLQPLPSAALDRRPSAGIRMMTVTSKMCA